MPPPTPDEFRERARATFGFRVDTIGYHTEPIPASGFHNPVAVWFANETTRIVVEGIGWGMHTRVALGRSTGTLENFDLGDLVAERDPEIDMTADALNGGQLAQLPLPAGWLLAYGADILSGDFRVFPQLQARVAQRAARFTP